MTHLEFSEKLNQIGIHIRATNTEHGRKTYPVRFGLGDRDVIVENLNVTWAENPVMHSGYDAMQSLIAKAIDMDEWKHSLHSKIEPENYEHFRLIIQDKILNRAKQIEELLTVYFVLGKEMVKGKEEQQ